MDNQFSQAFPPTPAFTEKSIDNLSGKVYIVTGASTGVGKELARLLYALNGTVYVAARVPAKAQTAIEWIKEQHPTSQGVLHHLYLDLSDLEGIQASADEFLLKEKRLDVLFNNAGVMFPPHGSTTKQGYELQLGTNCVGPFLFTKLLTPILVETAKKETTGSVRVIWVSSGAAHFSPTGGVDLQNLDYKTDKTKYQKYAISKAGNILHALEFQRRYKDSGIVSVVGTACFLATCTPTTSHDGTSYQLGFQLTLCAGPQPWKSLIRVTPPSFINAGLDDQLDNLSSHQWGVYGTLRRSIT